jgi:4-hydroxybenzoate polyprenyltransferase
MHLHGKMKEFLKLIRWPNLLIVILTMVLMRYAVIESLIGKISVEIKDGVAVMVPMLLQFSLVDFIILVAATVLITAGGYVINDYFDIKTDLINRGKVGTKIPRGRAMMWHSILNVAGVLAGFYVSWKAGYFWIGILFLLVTGLLYFYSASYKRQFLIGNLIVAILTAMVPLMVILFEWPAIYRYYSEYAVAIPDLSFLFYWIGGFSLFAFLTTLAREIIKDIEDFEGDIAYGRKTIPVVIGIPASKIVSVVLIFFTLAMLYLVWFFFVHDNITLIYITALLALPLLFVIFQITISRNKKQVHGASTLMKLIMLAGILYSVAVKAILTWNLF